MVMYKLTRLEDLPNRPRHVYSWPMKLVDFLLLVLVIAIMGTAVYVGSKPNPPQNGCDHVSYLAGRCGE